jgi:hypothetical protein
VNTNKLIDLLSTNLQPVARRGFERALFLVVAMGGVAALGLMLATVGPRPHLTLHLGWSAIKLLFGLSVVGTGMPILVRSAQPGRRLSALPLFRPFFVVSAAALATLLGTGPAIWKGMLLGATHVSPVRCLLCIVGFAAIPWMALFYMLREGAPTRPSVCGGLAGVVAGGVGAAAYAFTCSSDSIPFIASWYVAAIALCALVGALFGPRLLRW